jgi:hypothetical protein
MTAVLLAWAWAAAGAEFSVKLLGYWDGRCGSVVVRDDLAYVCGGARLALVDVSEPESPVEVGWFAPDMAPICMGVAVAGHYAYLTYLSGLSVIDVADPSAPKQVGQLHLTGASGVIVIGGYVYVAAHSNVVVFDVSDPAQPVQVALIPCGYAERLCAQGTLAVVADIGSAVRILDVSNPAAPVEIAVYNNGPFVQDAAISGNYVYVACEYEGLLILDVSNPAAPVQVGRWYRPGATVECVAVLGDYAFTLGSADVLRVFDVSDRAAPAVAAEVDMSPACGPPVARGSDVYVGGAGVSILQTTIRADANCDGLINVFDIDPFVLALVDPAGYVTQFPYCNIANGDINTDGAINPFDIDPFVELLIGT